MAVYYLYLRLEDFMRVRSSYCSVALVLGACYSTVPIQLSSAQPNTKLVVSLTDAGSDSLARYLGPGVATVGGGQPALQVRAQRHRQARSGLVERT